MPDCSLKRADDETWHDEPEAGTTPVSQERAESNSDRKASIEAVIHLGREIKDVAIIAQAQTALGQEFFWQGETESGLACCRAAIDTLSSTELPALAVPARRLLRWAREQRTDDDLDDLL